MSTFQGKPVTHKGHHGGRYDDPHGVTAPSSGGGHLSVGRYMGSVGDQHFYSAESTGGDSTDSISQTYPQRTDWRAPEIGSHAVIDTRVNSKGLSTYPRPYDPHLHSGLKGAPKAENTGEDK